MRLGSHHYWHLFFHAWLGFSGMEEFDKLYCDSWFYPTYCLLSQSNIGNWLACILFSFLHSIKKFTEILMLLMRSRERWRVRYWDSWEKVNPVWEFVKIGLWMFDYHYILYASRSILHCHHTFFNFSVDVTFTKLWHATRSSAKTSASVLVYSNLEDQSKNY